MKFQFPNVRQAVLHITVLVMFSNPAYAEPTYTVAELITGYENATADLRSAIEGDLNQMGKAFSAVNGLLVLQQRPPLICVPDAAIVGGRQMMVTIKDYVEKHPLIRNKKISSPAMLLLYAMKKAYPCQ